MKSDVNPPASSPKPATHVRGSLALLAILALGGVARMGAQANAAPAMTAPAMAAPAMAGGSLPSSASLVGPAQLEAIRREGRLLRAVSGAEALSPLLLPAHPAAQPLAAAIRAGGQSLLVEALFLLERPAPADPEGELLETYGIVRSVASLEGIEYWSESRKAWRTFYAESYRVDGLETRRRLEDGAPPARLPAAETTLAFQRDLSFGSNVYRYSFAGGAGAVQVESRNLTRMSYGPLPVLAPEALVTRLLVVPTREGLLFYAASAAKAAAIPGIRGKLEDSFGNRAGALFAWFGSLHEAARRRARD